MKSITFNQSENHAFRMLTRLGKFFIPNFLYCKASCLDTITNGKYDQNEANKWKDYYQYKETELPAFIIDSRLS